MDCILGVRARRAGVVLMISSLVAITASACDDDESSDAVRSVDVVGRWMPVGVPGGFLTDQFDPSKAIVMIRKNGTWRGAAPCYPSGGTYDVDGGDWSATYEPTVGSECQYGTVSYELLFAEADLVRRAGDGLEFVTADGMLLLRLEPATG